MATHGNEPNTIYNFVGEYEFLSNFWSCTILHDGIHYPSVEHAFQASKSFDLEIRYKISKLKRPGEAKRIGNVVRLRGDWEGVKILVMKQLLHQKFSYMYGNTLPDQLLATGNKELVEGNTWGDTFWGVCNGIGENHLGRLLMKIRGELKVSTEKWKEEITKCLKGCKKSS